MNLQYPLDDSRIAFKRVQIIKERSGKVLLMASNNIQTDFSVIIIKRAKEGENDWKLKQLVTEIHGSLKSEQAELEIARNVRKLSECQILNVQGVLGFAKYLQGYYLLYVQERETVARIGRHKIYLIKKVGIVPLFDPANDQQRNDQKEYYERLKSYKVENCYFSYTYDLTNSLSINMTRNAVELFESDKQHSRPSTQQSFYSHNPSIHGYCQIFQWNYNLLKEFSQVIDRKKWLIPVVHGYCRQINIKSKGTRFNVIIVSRRSRHHAGTRYIKRGMDQYGFVANFVETQQIVVNETSSQDTKPLCSSFVQVRGSAPIYWLQQPSLLVAKPDIEFVNSDPLFVSTRKHFSDLFARYGRKIYCVNLMKAFENTPRESLLSDQYSSAVEFINKYDLQQQNQLHYIHLDFKANIKQDKQGLVDKIHLLAYFCIMRTGLFVCLNSSRADFTQYVELQNGVIRGNCVDCLDRTNSFQQLVGEMALEIQIAKLLREDITYNQIKRDMKRFKEYGTLFEEMGDLISRQYGSSDAHKQKVNKTEVKRLEIFTSIKRHWNNNTKDTDRQVEIDTFLMEFNPEGPPLWKIKPPITFFPHRDMQRFEQGQWYGPACEYFQDQNLLSMLSKINEADKLRLRQLNRLELQELGRPELLMKFDIDVVDHLLNLKQLRQPLQYCVTPKLRLEKRVWREMNPKLNRVRPIEEKIKKEYQNASFKVCEQDEHRPAPEAFEERPSQQNTLKQLIRMPTVPQQSETDKLIAAEVRNYMDVKDDLDDDEKQLIESFAKNQIVTEQMIRQDLQAQKETLDDHADIHIDHTLTMLEWRQLEEKIRNSDFLRLDAVSPANARHRRHEKKKTAAVKMLIKHKVQKLEQHKTAILEEIVNKHFSHGQRVGRVSLI